jgi:hypothetical protein
VQVTQAITRSTEVGSPWSDFSLKRDHFVLSAIRQCDGKNGRFFWWIFATGVFDESATYFTQSPHSPRPCLKGFEEYPGPISDPETTAQTAPQQRRIKARGAFVENLAVGLVRQANLCPACETFAEETWQDLFECMFATSCTTLLDIPFGRIRASELVGSVSVS